MTKKQLLQAVCFTVLVALMLGGLSGLLRDKDTSMSSLYSEPDNTVDVFMVGSSHVNSGYMPGVLWQEYGISAHNVYSWSQPMWTSYYYIREGLKTQSPKVVVLDLNGMMYGNSNEQPSSTDSTNYNSSFTIDPGLNFLEFTTTVAKCGIDLRNPVDFWPLVRYHSSWKYLNEKSFTYNAHNDHDYLKGYGLQVLTADLAPQPAAETTQRAQPYETAVQYLEKIVVLSEAKGFKLIFVLTPYQYQPNEPAIYGWLADYAAQHDIPFYNYNAADGARIGLDWGEDFCDASHLNYKGALKLSRDLGEILTGGGYSLRTRAELSNADALDTDAEKLYRTLDLWTYTQTTPQAFFAWVRKTGGTLALGTAGDSAAVPAQAVQMLEAAGFSGLTDAMAAGESYAAVLCAGSLSKTTAGATEETAECTAGGLAVTGAKNAAKAGITYQGTTLTGGADGLMLVYYDTVLQRPVYRILIDADGSFTYEDIGSLA